MPDAEEVINSWMKQSKEKNNMFTNISFTHPDTGEAVCYFKDGVWF
jgi:hypothetical protein